MADCRNPLVTYRAIEGFPGYEVGTDGSVWSKRRRGPSLRDNDDWHRLKPGEAEGGYLFVILCRNDGKRHTKYIHSLVLETFVGPRPEGKVARHFHDPNPANCALGNLRWGSPVQNAEDRDHHGNTARGKKNGNSRLNEDAVREIRVAAGVGAIERMAEKYGVSRITIIHIRKFRAWKHVT